MKYLLSILSLCASAFCAPIKTPYVLYSLDVQFQSWHHWDDGDKKAGGDFSAFVKVPNNPLGKIFEQEIFGTFIDYSNRVSSPLKIKVRGSVTTQSHGAPESDSLYYFNLWSLTGPLWTFQAENWYSGDEPEEDHVYFTSNQLEKGTWYGSVVSDRPQMYGLLESDLGARFERVSYHAPESISTFATMGTVLGGAALWRGRRSGDRTSKNQVVGRI